MISPFLGKIMKIKETFSFNSTIINESQHKPIYARNQKEITKNKI